VSARESESVAERFLLDTSAVLTLTDSEEGADTVEGLLDRAVEGSCEVSICAVSLMEVFYVTLQEAGEDQAAHVVGLVKAWPVRWVYPNEEMLLLAGRIKAGHRLSFADSVIAAAAMAGGATLVHKDPEFQALAPDLEELRLPPKGAR
jgi:predicted nucleic acid-binding protein